MVTMVIMIKLTLESSEVEVSDSVFLVIPHHKS